jgi:hypothetical protein
MKQPGLMRFFIVLIVGEIYPQVQKVSKMTNVYIKFEGGWITAKSRQLTLVDEEVDHYPRTRRKECIGILVRNYTCAEILFIQTDKIEVIRTWKWNNEKLSMLGHPILDEILIWQKEGIKSSPKWPFWQKLKFLFSMK